MDKLFSPTAEQMENFLRRNGKRGHLILSTLGKNLQFYNAITSPIGEELLKDLTLLMEERLVKIANLEATPEETAEYRVAKKLALVWAERINSYKSNINDIIKS